MEVKDEAAFKDEILKRMTKKLRYKKKISLKSLSMKLY
jgi:hypothetical protein